MAYTALTKPSTGDVLTATAYGNLIDNTKIGHIVCTSGTRPTGIDEGTMIYQTDDDRVLVYNGSAWVTITPVSTWISASRQTTTSTSYVDLTGDLSTSIQTGTKALVTFGAELDTSAAAMYAYLAVDITGATTTAAADGNAITIGQLTVNAVIGCSKTILFSSLTAGVNTFRLRYRVTAGTGGYQNRFMSVVGIP